MEGESGRLQSMRSQESDTTYRLNHHHHLSYFLQVCTNIQASLVVQRVSNLPVTRESLVPSLDWDDPLEKGMVTHPTILQPGGLQSMSRRVGHDWETNTVTLFPNIHHRVSHYIMFYNVSCIIIYNIFEVLRIYYFIHTTSFNSHNDCVKQVLWCLHHSWGNKRHREVKWLRQSSKQAVPGATLSATALLHS